jgi:hypothetical protein
MEHRADRITTDGYAAKLECGEVRVHLSQSVIDELAYSWVRLHRSAARAHLEFMILNMRRSGDADGAINYSRVLDAIRAKRRDQLGKG